MKDVAKKLLSWYEDNARKLPWRGVEDPYAILVSEIMLQQTRVETVIPYYRRWMERFPTIETLAHADLDDVLNLWEGLGYYRRARYLHQAAQQVVQQHNGRIPSENKRLRELPGIGLYTAAALGAIAFDQDQIALDGNLKRVLARLINLELDIKKAEAQTRLREHARSLMPAGKASAFNQALMDLGATICTPTSPSCEHCPLSSHCQAHALGLEEERPIRQRRDEIPHVKRSVAVVLKDDSVLLGRRPVGGLLGGLWEFPGMDGADEVPAEDALSGWITGKLGLAVGEWRRLSKHNHAYSHFKVTAIAYAAEWQSGRPESEFHTEVQWRPLNALGSLAMGKIDRSIAAEVQDR
ncbi:MAG: A/G-specific adenine glycosylase [Anaerolineales bacterium]